MPTIADPCDSSKPSLPRYSDDPAAYHRAYYRLTRERRLAMAAAYAQANPEKVAELQRSRRAARKAAGGVLSKEQCRAMFDYYGGKCLACGAHESEVLLTADHVIPATQGGSNNLENRQPLCRPCNSVKHTQTTDYRPDAAAMVAAVIAAVGLPRRPGAVPGHVVSAETRMRLSRSHDKRCAASKSGVRGVLHHPGRAKPWQARPYINGKFVSLGYFATVEEAADAIGRYTRTL